MQTTSTADITTVAAGSVLKKKTTMHLSEFHRRSLFENTPFLLKKSSPTARSGGGGKKVIPIDNDIDVDVDITPTVHVARSAAKKEPRANPIPLPPYHIPRTSSEVQLSQEMEAAEWRERVMFQRLVSGMKMRHAINSERMRSLERKMARTCPPALVDGGDAEVQLQQHQQRQPQGQRQSRRELAAVLADAYQLAPVVTPCGSPLDKTGDKTRMTTTPQPQPQPSATPQPQPQPAPNGGRHQHLANMLSKVSGQGWDVGCEQPPAPLLRPASAFASAPAVLIHQHAHEAAGAAMMAGGVGGGAGGASRHYEDMVFSMDL